MNDMHSLVHAYVVDALDPDETREFERHLADCPSCTHEVSELRELTAHLADHVAVDPPPTLRASVLAAIAATPQHESPSASAHVAATDAGSPADVVPLRPHRGAERHKAPVPRRRRWGTALVAAAVLAAVGLGGWAWQSQQELDESQQVADAATAETAQLTQLLAAEDVETVHGEFASGGEGVVVFSRSEGDALLLGNDLAKLADDEVYQAWLVEGAPVSVGTFTPDGSQSLVELPDEAVETEAVAVSIEPTGGSEQPTSDPVFAVEIPR